MKRSEIYFSVALIPLDYLALLGAFIVAYYLRNSGPLFSGELVGDLSSRLQYSPGSSILPLTQYMHYIWYIIPMMLVVFAVSGLYAIRPTTSLWQRIVQVIFGVSAGEFLILLLFLLKRDFFIPRSSVIFSWVLGIVLVVVLRQLVRLVQRFLRAANVGVIRVGIVGSSPVAKQISKALVKDRAFYAIAFESAGKNVEDVIDLIKANRADELILVNDQYTADDLILIRNVCLENRVSFSFVPQLLTSLQSVFNVRYEAGIPMIEVQPTPLEGWGRVYKRLFDVVMSIILIIISLPFNIVISLILKLTNRGPLLIRHKRIGRGGDYIYISKYRTMKLGWTDENGKLSANFQKYLDAHPDAEKEWRETQKLKDDPRISSAGKILRKTRLDELPQFFDVLTGALSLVGPRPIIDAEVERFGEKARILFTVRPGITGLWQVEGGNELSYDQRVIHNSYYIEHWTPWLDVVILAKTTWIVIVDVFTKLLGIEGNDATY